MFVQNNPRYAIEGSPHRCHLYQHIGAGATLLNHGLNTANVALNAGQAVDNAPQRLGVVDVGVSRTIGREIDLLQVRMGVGARVMQGIWAVKQ
jgi:hypothetical protein